MDVDEEGRAGTGVTTGALARKLGISPTTLRSWDRRYGLGPAARIEGHHRRWTVEDVAMVQEMCRLTAQGLPPAEAARAAKTWAAEYRAPAPRPAAASPGPLPEPPTPSPSPDPPSADVPPPADWRRRCRGLARAAVRMDAEAVHEQITAAVESYGLVTAWEEVLTPTLRSVGRKWESSEDRYVEVEHLLSWQVSAALRSAYARGVTLNGTGDGRPVLLACLPGEHHTLPLEALTAALAEHGQRVLMLGGSVPVESLEATVRRTAPAAVALWSQSRGTADLPLCRHLMSIRWGIHGARTRSHVLLCGPGWGRRWDPGLLRPRGLGEAVRILLSAGRLGDDGPLTAEGHEAESA
ncbi:MerR family transcriptional regulator [Streptomyces sp. NPDC005017]|uniref:MerR family transcriptional regulator n=1 Tax=Streptomyces sp. NPDC005017 TaxID=3364706 RepID=UPI00368F0ADE